MSVLLSYEQGRKDATAACVAAVRQALCGMCANVANGIGLVTQATLFDGHWAHLWKETGSYAQRCAADIAVTALQVEQEKQ